MQEGVGGNVDRIDIIFYGLIALSLANSYFFWQINEQIYSSNIALESELSKLNHAFKYAERSKLFDSKNLEKTKSNGYYFGEGYYCVWTKDRKPAEIMSFDPYLDRINVTAFHELTHAMMRTNLSHFCWMYNYTGDPNFN